MPDLAFVCHGLERVVYELFDDEDSSTVVGKEMHRVRRQIRLDGRPGEHLYISWLSVGGLHEFEIALRHESFFTLAAHSELDVSWTPLWQGMIGCDPILQYDDRHKMWLKIRSENHCVYCCCFQSDVIFVMPRKATPAS